MVGTRLTRQPRSLQVAARVFCCSLHLCRVSRRNGWHDCLHEMLQNKKPALKRR
jgi:hypothetical protein